MKFGCMAIVLVVAGCEATSYQGYKAGKPLTSFPYKANASDAVLQNEMLDCQVDATQRVPQRTVVSTTPTYTTPVQTFCNQIGYQTICNSTGGQTYGGNVVTSDANSGLRDRVYMQCMARKGWDWVNIPACPAGVGPENLTRGRNNGLPVRTSATCYLSREDTPNLVYIGNQT